jgi:hypothetical protein
MCTTCVCNGMKVPVFVPIFLPKCVSHMYIHRNIHKCIHTYFLQYVHTYITKDKMQLKKGSNYFLWIYFFQRKHFPSVQNLTFFIHHFRTVCHRNWRFLWFFDVESNVHFSSERKKYGSHGKKIDEFETLSAVWMGAKMKREKEINFFSRDK